MKKLIAFLFVMICIKAFTQPKEMPLLAYKGTDQNKPVIYYISGDGGWNSFSTSLIKGFTNAGYSVIALNSRSYFWTRKSPQQAAADVSSSINQYAKAWNIKSIVFIGYSFGADVMPFIQTSLPVNLSNMVHHIILMSPSRKTDFEIHLLGMMGLGNSHGKSVPDEINKLNIPVTLIFGSDENDFPVRDIKVKKIETIKLAGGHHYDGNVDELIKKITDKIK
ncbi:MAG TPA: AcvB/VirJ family lysyl-phosphatidylglycerol hydrolase [Flavisolibacter sp.]|jgi:type IV secretory pathway VirJ component|nr:AcvB/VirJ family lysyl-phosphatidylglycerol hydrolase [Flavisolibacter sp.]